MVAMTEKNFNEIRQIVYDTCGISLGPQKQSLVSARISKRLRHLSLEDIGDYLSFLKDDESGNEIIHLLDAISTNTTHFFRESAHFTFLTDLVKEWMAKGQQRFRVWCAASSTGEEPYTIAMSMLEATKGQRADIRILATDINTQVLRHAQQGEYTQKAVEGIPAALLSSYFTKNKNSDGSTSYTANQSLKELIIFRRFNLATDTLPTQRPLDIVFCRNVMIYFDNIVRTRLLNEIYRVTRPGGYLMVGHSESLTGLVSDFKGVRPSVYTRP